MKFTYVLFFIASFGLSVGIGFVLDGEGTTQDQVDSLKALLTQETASRMELETKVNGLVAKIDTVKSTQDECGCAGAGTDYPAFMASLSADLLHCSRQQPVVFDSVKLNVGNSYNNNHGVFTAPIAGTYAFTATLSVIPNNMYHTAFVKNNASNEIGYLYTDPLQIWLERSTTVLTHLDIGDEVWMVCLSDSRIEGDHNHGWEGANDFHSHMSGFLVST